MSEDLLRKLQLLEDEYAGQPPVVRQADLREINQIRAQLGMPLGPPWATFWFRIEAAIPETWAGQRVDLLWETGTESTIWIGDRAVQGLNTSGSCPRPDAPLVEQAEPGQELELLVETACSGAFGQHDPPAAGTTLRRCELARFEELAEAVDLVRIKP